LGVCFKAAIEQEHDHEQEQEERGSRSSSKKITAPHTRRGVKGGCSPQNNRRKPSRLLNELAAGGNKILYENFYNPSTGGPPWQKSEELRMNDKVNLGQAVGTVRNRSEIGLHERASRSLVLYA
jgi:hypothetical protein